MIMFEVATRRTVNNEAIRTSITTSLYVAHQAHVTLPQGGDAAFDVAGDDAPLAHLRPQVQLHHRSIFPHIFL